VHSRAQGPSSFAGGLPLPSSEAGGQGAPKGLPHARRPRAWGPKASEEGRAGRYCAICLTAMYSQLTYLIAQRTAVSSSLSKEREREEETAESTSGEGIGESAALSEGLGESGTRRQQTLKQFSHLMGDAYLKQKITYTHLVICSPGKLNLGKLRAQSVARHLLILRDIVCLRRRPTRNYMSLQLSWRVTSEAAGPPRRGASERRPLR